MINQVNIYLIKKMIDQGKYTTYVKGNSMKPSLNEGMKIHIKKFNNLLINDIVFAYVYDRFVIHRIIDMYKDVVITKGDNNTFADQPIKKENILGVLTEEQNIKLDIPKNNTKKIVINFWEENYLSDNIKDLLNLFRIKYVNEPEKIDSNMYNIALSPVSTVKINELNLLEINKDINIHIGVRISDFKHKNFYHKDNFDKVVRSGSYTSSYFLNNEQNLLILIGQLL